jgi:hypothetical protein
MTDALRSYQEAQALNLAVVSEHFHNETPDTVDKAIALYADEITWEGPARGLVYTDPAEVKQMYLGIYKTLKIHSHTQLHRFATDEWVFDDCIYVATIVDDQMRNLPFPVGTKVSMRLTHAFQLRDGRICRENAYEIWRRADDVTVNDDIPADAVVTIFDEDDPGYYGGQ